MVDCSIYVNLNYKKAYENYLNIDNTGQCIIEEERIIYGDMIFLNRGKWCLIITTSEDTYCEEVLLEMSSGKKLAYFFSDDAQMDCECIVVIIIMFYEDFFVMVILRNLTGMMEDWCVKIT